MATSSEGTRNHVGARVELKDLEGRLALNMGPQKFLHLLFILFQVILEGKRREGAQKDGLEGQAGENFVVGLLLENVRDEDEEFPLVFVVNDAI